MIKEFRAGETKILIATDVLARGFDQAQVCLHHRGLLVYQMRFAVCVHLLCCFALITYVAPYFSVAITLLLIVYLNCDQVTLVVNYDLPVKNNPNKNAYAEPDFETYLHRIGRSGRFGRKGKSSSSFCPILGHAEIFYLGRSNRMNRCCGVLILLENLK